MTEFDFTPGQKAFISAMWVASAACTATVLLFDAARSLVRKATTNAR